MLAIIIIIINMGKMPKEIGNTMNTTDIVTMVGCVGSRCMGSTLP